MGMRIQPDICNFPSGSVESSTGLLSADRPEITALWENLTLVCLALILDSHEELTVYALGT
jgi:hypothetical protein